MLLPIIFCPFSVAGGLITIWLLGGGAPTDLAPTSIGLAGFTLLVGYFYVAVAFIFYWPASLISKMRGRASA